MPQKSTEKKKGWQITEWGKAITESGYNEFRNSDYSVEEHPYTFKAYDDDNYFYAGGTVRNLERFGEWIFNYLQGGWGVTLIKFYDRRTGKYIDAMG